MAKTREQKAEKKAREAAKKAAVRAADMAKTIAMNEKNPIEFAPPAKNVTIKSDYYGDVRRMSARW